MKIFIAVCEYKSITLAAEKLYLAQPTVSLAISELEAHYGVKLFDRISRKLYLTELGMQFLNYATHIVSLFDEMEKGIKNWDYFGTLRIGASITIGTLLLPQYVSLFYQTYPHIKVHAVIDNSEEIEQRVMVNDIDFALIEGVIHNPHIKSLQFMEDEMILICGNNHVLSNTKQLNIEQLKKYDFILREKGSGTRELFDSTMLIHNIDIKPIWESVSTQAIVKAVSAGLGISVLPYRLVKSELETECIKHIIIKDVSFKRQFYIIYHENKFLTSSAKEFINLCKTHIF
jgi:DNA-binding transcriptional LysR family regulator